MKRRGKLKTETLAFRHANETTEKLFERFILQKRAENISEETILLYKCHVQMFLDSLNDDQKEQPAWQVCVLESYNNFVSYRQQQGAKDITVASSCRSIRSFFYWMMENECIASFKVKIPKYQKTIPETYTDEELSELLVKPEKNCSYVDYESWVFINLAIATGLRLSSMLSIKVSDINFDENTIDINYTKTNIAQKLVINDELLKILDKYIRLFDLNEDSYLFCTAEGAKLAKRSMEDYIRRYENKRGVKKAKIIHAFRHTFARNYYLQTHDMYRLRDLLGHTTISTTEHYLGTLGLDTSTKIEYNPQVRFAEDTKKKVKKIRRGKM